MWRKQPEPRPSPSEKPSDWHSVVERAPIPELRSEASRLGKGIAVKGEISGQEDLFVDGEVEGTIRLPGGRVTVGPNGRVRAEIEAREIVVGGRVEGDLRGHERVRLLTSAAVTGNLAAQRLAIEDGAFFRGRVEMARAGEEAPQRRAAAAAAGAEPFRSSLPSAERIG